MQTLFTPQTLALLGLVALLILALLARRFQQHGHPPKEHSRYGPDHTQDIADLAQRTRAEAERKEREHHGLAAPRTVS